MPRTAVWTPRHTKQLWGALSKQGSVEVSLSPSLKWGFAPTINGPWREPPPPRPIKYREKGRRNKDMYDGTPSDLTDEAVSLRAQAMKLDNSGEIPSMKIQLGLLLLAKG